MITVRSIKPLNLFTAPEGTEVIHVPKNVNTVVPDTVKDHPGFQILIDDGLIIEVKTPAAEAQSQDDKDALLSKSEHTGSMGDNEVIAANRLKAEQDPKEETEEDSEEEIDEDETK
jgi:hypothetical protein